VTIISEEDSNIEHLLVEGRVRHVIIKTVQKTTPEIGSYNEFDIANVSSRRTIRGEFQGKEFYDAPRVYTHVYYKFLD